MTAACSAAILPDGASNDTRNPSALSLADLNTSINHEPRVLDVRIGERLGMAQPTDIRRTIEANRPELERYGEVSARRAKTSRKGGRPATEYWLNEAQTILLCMLARTDAAADVRQEVITVFMTFRTSSTPGLSPIEAEVVGQLRRMTPAQRDHLRAAAVAGRLKSEGSPSAPGGAALPPPPAEPFFCTGCAVRGEWFSRPDLHQRAAERSPDRATPADIRTFPMLSGPITTPEVDLMAAHRLALQDAKDRHNAETVRAVAAALGVPIDAQDPPGAGRRLAPPKKGA